MALYPLRFADTLAIGEASRACHAEDYKPPLTRAAFSFRAFLYAVSGKHLRSRFRAERRFQL